MPKIKKLPSVMREEAMTKAFKVALINNGWTMAHLGELCGMDGARVSRVINEPMKVRLETVLNIAAKLGINSIPTK